jgi:hypothetical protein
MEMSVEIHELATALAKAQAQMDTAKKDGLNPHFSSRFSTLASVWEACRGPLTEHGLSVIQGANATGADVAITTLLLHTSGQWVRETLTMIANDHKPQSVGSAISYGKRYLLASMVGIAPGDDDDAEAAEGRKAPNVKAVAQKEKHGGAPQPTKAGDAIVRPGRPVSKEEMNVRADGAVLLLEVAPAFAPAKMQLVTATGETLPMFRDEHIATALKACQDVLFVMIDTAIGKKSGKPYVHAIAFAPKEKVVLGDGREAVDRATMPF